MSVPPDSTPVVGRDAVCFECRLRAVPGVCLLAACQPPGCALPPPALSVHPGERRRAPRPPARSSRAASIPTLPATRSPSSSPRTSSTSWWPSTPIPVSSPTWPRAGRWADGGLTYIFHLRRGVRWHDGRPSPPPTSAGPSSGCRDSRSACRRGDPPDRADRDAGRCDGGDPAEEPWAPFLAPSPGTGRTSSPATTRTASPRTGRSAPARSGSASGSAASVSCWASPGVPSARARGSTGWSIPSGSGSVQAAELLLAGAGDYTLVRTARRAVPAAGARPRHPDRHASRATPASTAPSTCAARLSRTSGCARRSTGRSTGRRLVDRALHGYGAPAFGFYTPAVAWAYNGDAHVPAHDRERARALLADGRSRPAARAGAPGALASRRPRSPGCSSGSSPPSASRSAPALPLDELDGPRSRTTTSTCA